MGVIRSGAWIAHMVSGGMVSLALLLAWFNHERKKHFLAESAYLCIFSSILLCLSAGILCYRYTLMARVDKRVMVEKMPGSKSHADLSDVQLKMDMARLTLGRFKD